MKRFLQVVAVLVAALIAVPPAVAAHLCTLLQGTVETHLCCTHAASAPSSSTHHAGAACGMSCCSIAPQAPAPQNAPDRSKAGGVSMTSSQDACSALSGAHAASTRAAQPPGHPSPARYLLFNVFRI